MKNQSKVQKFNHVSNTKMGMGDFYGTGLRAKVGKVIDGYSTTFQPLSKKEKSNPPKSLA